MGLRVNVRAAFKNASALIKLRLASQNARHAMAKAGVERIRAGGLSADQVKDMMNSSPRGFYSGVVEYGHQGIREALREAATSHGQVGKDLATEFDRVHKADALFAGFDAISINNILDLKVHVYPGMETIDRIGRIFPEQMARAGEVIALIEQNLSTPADQPSPIVLLEDHPAWASEKPDIRNIRGNMAEAVQAAKDEAAAIAKLVDTTYGAGTIAKIKNVVVIGIGANDMYLKALPMLVNADSARQRSLYSIFEPSQLDALPEGVKLENTLFIPISRSGGTQETIKCMYFGKKQGQIKQMVGYANKGLLRDLVDTEAGISLNLERKIGGRYMWAKGKIVLVPLALTASQKAWEEYTGAMVEFDSAFWPVGEDKTVIDLARHFYLYNGAYNMAGLFVSSNHPVLEAGLREILQLHNEAVGKVINGTIAFGSGMEMLPFAHAGADGVLGSAISAQHYGAFIFDESLSLRGPALTAKDILSAEADHAGLTKDLLQMACVFPNQAKFTYAGAPNFMITMEGVNLRNLATLTAVYQNIMYPYLIMNGTNPDSNPNVDMVRKTTKGLLTALIEAIIVKKTGQTPMEVVRQEVPRIMKG